MRPFFFFSLFLCSCSAGRGRPEARESFAFTISFLGGVKNRSSHIRKGGKTGADIPYGALKKRRGCGKLIA
jgi:hypothetical protein